MAALHAAGAQVLVATEHDRVVDPRPTIALLGLSAQIAGVTGVEVTSEYRGGESPFTIGHANAFPLDVQPEAYRGGAPRAEGRRLRDVWAELRARGVPLLQLNHPRASLDPADGHSFLNHLGVGGSGFDPSRPLASHTSLLERGTHGFRDLDFDAIELLNGSDHEAYARVRADWFSLHLQGKHLTGTANSDSHDLRHPVAVPRNYVRLAGGVADFDAPAFAVAVRRGELWGTTGPLLDVSLDGTGVGGTHRGPDAALRASVRAAPWVPVRELRVYVNGVLAERRELAVPAVEEIPLHFAEDAFVTVEVVGEPEGLYATLLPGFRPLAFTNAIYVDAEADGSWTPPGLPPTRAGW